MAFNPRKTSAETRRKLRALAKQRWKRFHEEKQKQQEQPAPIAAAPVPVGGRGAAPVVLSATDAAEFERRAGSAVAARGRGYFAERSRFRLEASSAASAKVRVQGSQSYLVQFVRMSENEVVAFCGCPYENGDENLICDHKVAAALFLTGDSAPSPAPPPQEPAARPALRVNGTAPRPAPVKPAVPQWKEQLDQILRKDLLPQKRALREALLFFSFFRHGRGYDVQPGMIEADAVPRHLWEDRKGLRNYLVKHQRDQNLRFCIQALESGHLDAHRWVNAQSGAEALVRQTLQQSHYASHYFQPVVNWRDLVGCLTFLGTENQLIREAIEVRPETASVEMELELGEAGLRLSLAAVLPDRTIPLASPGLKVFHTSPFWLSEGGEVFQAALDPYRFNQLRNKAAIEVPFEALDEFYQRNFEGLLSAYPLRGVDLGGEPLRGVAPQPRVYLIEEDGALRAQLRFAYNNLVFFAAKKTPAHAYARDPERDTPVRVERAVEAESEWWRRIGSDEFGLRCGNLHEGTTQDTFVLRAKVHPFDFLKNYVPKLTEAGVEIFGQDDLTLGRINRAQALISFHVGTGIDWFDLKAVVHFGDLEVSLAEVRKAMRHKERFIKLADGTIGEIPPEWLEKYKHLFGLAETTEDGLRVARHHIALLDQLLSDNEQVTTDKQFEASRLWLKNFEGIASHDLPKGFQGELRPYQKAGFDWLYFLRESRFGGCLADDMGTGKTIQALCFLQSLKESRSRGKRKTEPRSAHLLVVPRSLVTNWEREGQKFTPDLKVLNFSQTERAADVAEFDQYDVVLTTYGILLREIERLKEYEFDTAILDEAQAIKNPLSESAKAARQLKCRHRLTLTGTPVENNTLELWSQFAFLNPGLLGSADYFREGFTGPIERENDEEAVKTLRRLVYPFILRRTKDQVALDLPPRSEKILWNEMEPEQRRLYTQTRDEYRALILKMIEDKGIKDARFRILEGLLRLRQICNHPRLVKPGYQGGSAKLDALLETIETLQAEGHKALIFSQFVQMLRIVERELKKAKIPYAYLDGSTVNRQARVDAFQTDEKIRVFLISLKAGGVGLNLTAADYVIHIDPWWNPAVEMQATDRAHRIGQDKPVFVYKLMMRDSVEEKILQLQDRKRNLVKQLIATEAGFFKSLTADDIRSLFS
jgi:non-specific serine/threonine protein kinase